MTDHEPITESEAAGRAFGLAISLVLERRVKSAEELAEVLESYAYDDTSNPRTVAVVMGMLEGISVFLHGGPDAQL